MVCWGLGLAGHPSGSPSPQVSAAQLIPPPSQPGGSPSLEHRPPPEEGTGQDMTWAWEGAAMETWWHWGRGWHGILGCKQDWAWTVRAGSALGPWQGHGKGIWWCVYQWVHPSGSSGCFSSCMSQALCPAETAFLERLPSWGLFVTAACGQSYSWLLCSAFLEPGGQTKSCVRGGCNVQIYGTAGERCCIALTTSTFWVCWLTFYLLPLHTVLWNLLVLKQWKEISLGMWAWGQKSYSCKGEKPSRPTRCMEAHRSAAAACLWREEPITNYLVWIWKWAESFMLLRIGLAFFFLLFQWEWKLSPPRRYCGADL